MIWGVVLLAVAGQSPLDTPITFDGPASHLPAAMKAIGDQAEVEIMVQGAPERDYIYLHFTKRPLKAVLDGIARATESKWSQTGPNNFKIYAPWPPVASSIVARTLKIQAWLDANPVSPALTRAQADKLVTDALDFSATARNTGDDNQSKQSNALSDRTPNYRLIRRIAHHLGAQKLAAVKPGEIQEWRVEPRGKILGGGPKLDTLLQDRDNESGAYAEALARKGVSEQAWKPEYGHVPALYDYFDPPAIDGHLRILVDANEQGLSITASRVDDDGDYQPIPAYQFIPIATYLPDEPSVFAPYAVPFKTPESWTAMSMSAESRDRWLKAGARPVIPEAARQQILGCAEDETLTAGSDLLFRALADASGHDVVAVVPDAFLLRLIYGVFTQPKLSEVLARMYPQASCELADGILVVSPTGWMSPRDLRVSRHEAAAAFRELAEKGFVSLDVMANLAAAQDTEISLSSTEGYLTLLGFERVNPTVEFDLLKIYGLLSAAQRKAAASEAGAIVPVSGSSSLSAAVRDALYASNAQVRESAEEWDDRISEDRPPTSQESDPNWVFAQGLPGGSHLKVRLIQTKKLYRSMKSNGGYTTPNMVSEFDMVMEEQVPLFADSVYAQVPVLEMQVSIIAPGVGTVQRKATIPEIGTKTVFGDRTALPQDALDRIEAARKKIRGGGN
jgi:hypothetical protein